VLHTAATANGVHGFHWFTVCAPAGWDPASDGWEVCSCGWRRELGKHYAKSAIVIGFAEAGQPLKQDQRGLRVRADEVIE
jgi:hypothetical protein